MLRTLNVPALLGLCVFVFGCPFLVVGDGVVVVKGQIADEQGGFHQGCFVELLYSPDWFVSYRRILADYQVVEVEFAADFTVAPGNRPYRIRIGCATSAATFTSPTVTVGASLKPVDLGVIVLPRKQTEAQ